MKELDFYFDGKVCTTYLDEKGEPWWLARDVCDILGLKDVSMSLQRLEDDEKMIQKLFVSSKTREVWLINEPGLYSLVLTSNKPEAKAFKWWITHEVIPSIRKNGSYRRPEGKELLAIALKEADRIIQELEPKAIVADAIASAQGLKTISEFGKISGVGPLKIFELLKNKGIIFKLNGSWVPYQGYIDDGYFVVKEKTYEREGKPHLYSMTYITGKGEVWLARKLFVVDKQLHLLEAFNG